MSLASEIGFPVMIKASAGEKRNADDKSERICITNGARSEEATVVLAMDCVCGKIC